MAQQSHDQQDCIVRFKSLVPQLKEELMGMMQSGADCLQHYASKGTSQSTSQQQFEKALEKFHTLCDETELQLRLALECASVNSDMGRYVGITLHNPRPDDTQHGASEIGQGNLTQYTNLLKTQVKCIGELQQLTSNIKSTEQSMDDR